MEEESICMWLEEADGQEREYEAIEAFAMESRIIWLSIAKDGEACFIESVSNLML